MWVKASQRGCVPGTKGASKGSLNTWISRILISSWAHNGRVRREVVQYRWSILLKPGSGPKPFCFILVQFLLVCCPSSFPSLPLLLSLLSLLSPLSPLSSLLSLLSLFLSVFCRRLVRICHMTPGAFCRWPTRARIPMDRNCTHLIHTTRTAFVSFITFGPCEHLDGDHTKLSLE